MPDDIKTDDKGPILVTATVKNDITIKTDVNSAIVSIIDKGI